MPSGVYKRTEYHREICRKNSHFKKGVTSWNKGKHTPTNTGKTWFKKGNRLSGKTKNKMSKSRKGNLYAFKTGRIKLAKGYIGIYIPTHPFAYHKHRYVPEHRLVVEEQIGRYLQPKERVHHLNKIKNDNRPKNLMAFINDGFHHKFERGKKVPLNTIIFDGRKYKR